MNKTEFLDALRKTPRDWQIDFMGHIRRSGGQCPITSLRDEPDGNYLYVALEFGLSTDLTLEIMDAADCITGTGTFRDELLDACGIQEQEIELTGELKQVAQCVSDVEADLDSFTEKLVLAVS